MHQPLHSASHPPKEGRPIQRMQRKKPLILLCNCFPRNTHTCEHTALGTLLRDGRTMLQHQSLFWRIRSALCIGLTHMRCCSPTSPLFLD